MRRILMLSLVAAAACGPSRTNVEVSWTFGGLACDQAGVARIDFSIAGEVLSPDHYSCAEAGQGAGLGSYLDGNYQLTVSGFDATGTLTHQGTTTLNVHGGGTRTFNVDVPQVASTAGSVTLNWTFGGKTCAQAGITVVHASVDSQVLTDQGGNPDLPCSQAGVDGTTVSPLPAGQHAFDLVGVDAGGQSRYALNNYVVTVVAGQDSTYNPDLSPAAPTTASADLTWTFKTALTGGVAQSCATANIDHVTIFVDPDSGGNGGVNAGTVPCNTAGTDGASVEGLTPGLHSFAIVGIRTLSDGAHILYRTHNPPQSYFAVGLISDVFVSAEPLP